MDAQFSLIYSIDRTKPKWHRYSIRKFEHFSVQHNDEQIFLAEIDLHHLASLAYFTLQEGMGNIIFFNFFLFCFVFTFTAIIRLLPTNDIVSDLNRYSKIIIIISSTYFKAHIF